MITYRIELTPDDNGTFLVTSPDFPELATFGAGEEEARARAVDAMEEALAARIARRQPIPSGAEKSRKGEQRVRLPMQTALKIELVLALQAAGVTRAELARRLGWHREQVDRLFRVDHASRLGQIEAAFKALGREIDIGVRSAA